MQIETLVKDLPTSYSSDVNDINNSYASEAPVIVINPKNNVREGKSTKMTQTEIGLSLLKYAEKYEPGLTDYAKMVLDDATKAEKKKKIIKNKGVE